MSAVKIRKEIKKAVDRLEAKKLESLANYVQFLSQPTVAERIASARKAIAAGKGVNWRKVRSDV
jgi:hypothetical protein